MGLCIQSMLKEIKEKNKLVEGIELRITTIVEKVFDN